MASTLLNCSICPKRPNFSDTSHLLTHVGSKGHLSYLHKLQVRSHQEIAAGHQLAAYNQWYQQNGLGQLLSERMLLKEAKTTTKTLKTDRGQQRVKKENAARSTYSSHFPNDSPVAMSTASFRVKHRPATSRRTKHRMTPEDDSDYISSPVRRSRQRKSRRNLSSPVKHPSTDEGYPSSEPDCAAEDDLRFPTTPDSSKLKGVIWPGMDLFDAAPAEMRRRRNQKKDGSMIIQMKKTSAAVEPTEVVFSPGGTMRKQRHIDGLVDDSSPLKGETPIPKPPARRRRLPLANISANVQRLSSRPTKAIHHGMSDIRDLMRIPKTQLHVPSSSAARSYESDSRFSPTDDENMEFKLTLSALTNRTKTGNFTIFNDHGPRYTQSAMMVHDGKEDANPHPAILLNQTATLAPKPQLSFVTAPWLRPQNQQYLQCNAGYPTYRSHLQFQNYQEIGHGKENFQLLASNIDYGDERPSSNPLGWQYPASIGETAVCAQITPSSDIPNGFGGFFGSIDDPFGGFKNPLSAAVGQFDGAPDSSSDNVRQGVASPDGTISDPDGIEYIGFETSE